MGGILGLERVHQGDRLYIYDIIGSNATTWYAYQAHKHTTRTNNTSTL